MVDFSKRINRKKVDKLVNPIDIYESLDRASDKGPLRPAQLAVLNDWFSNRLTDRDVIVKLHTGQGKTLIGLLMLQSKLNSNNGPAVYLCPDNFLIAQTIEQAKQFGIATCQVDSELPAEFLEGKLILVTSIQKLFNGLTKFGLKNKSIPVGTLLMDDAHACSDSVRESCRIRIPSDEQAYKDLITLFSSDLEKQGAGSYMEIKNGKRDTFLPVPYWSWINHCNDVTAVIAKSEDSSSIKFAWPLLKNILEYCQCVISGTAIEIEPYIAPLSDFGSYFKASSRIFMSATVTDDAFLVKGLQLNPSTILQPLIYKDEKWSGEKMVLVPSLISEELDREWIVKHYGKPNSKRTSGVVALTTSFSKTKDWESYKSVIADKKSVNDKISELRKGQFENTLVLVNRYDGVDLPDDTCRTLIFDGSPYSESLIDLYEESCRPKSASTLMRTVRTVEQGMGRSVRGEKDYSVIIITGTDLTLLIRSQESRKYLSPQMSRQIEIGLEVVDLVKQDLEEGNTAEEEFNKLLLQCLKRDQGWKEYYSQEMNLVKSPIPNEDILKIYQLELEAETAYLMNDSEDAIAKTQDLIDRFFKEKAEKGWYLQQIARYNYKLNRPESIGMQGKAYKCNRYLLKPEDGVKIEKLTCISHNRIGKILSWVKNFKNYEQLNIALSDILGQLKFGTKADKFEQALHDIGIALGFNSERPDKIWKEGPDNIWALDARQYILFECKNEVDSTRKEIHKTESEQMNRSSAWFEKYYPGMDVKRIIIHPSKCIGSAASFTHDVQGMGDYQLKKIVKNISNFFKSFESFNFDDLSNLQIQQLIDSHELSTSSIVNNYSIN